MKVVDNRPSERFFHGAVIYKKMMYIFGGKNNGFLNDFWQYNFADKEWSEVSVNSGRLPSGRYGHTMVVHRNSLYVYGGYDVLGYHSDEIFEYRFDLRNWYKVETFSVSIEPQLYLERTHHTAVVYNDSMYIYGGEGENKENSMYYNDLLRYCFETRTWTRVYIPGFKPRPRWGHTSVIFDGKMYILGGKDSVVSFKDIYRYSFEAQSWKKKEVGDQFTPRFFHSATILNNSMLVFAGCNMHTYLYNELFDYKFNVDCMEDNFKNEMVSLILEEEYSDVTFVFEEEEKFLYGHKAILSTRSEAFKAMFQSGMKEAEARDIVITDRYKVFKGLLEYIYSNKAPVRFKKVDDWIELLYLADLYFLLNLKFRCEKELKQRISYTNVEKIWTVSEEHSIERLRLTCVKSCAKYIALDMMLLEDLPIERQNEIIDHIDTHKRNAYS
eukprot:TRINITY_DN3031_c2_g1_i3.p1 TRINITY_DN3031_c2_g1~~TRINITY_DN3031_c2_g1_i3.p1  ORF type:complete len:441 (-),score=87.87 TRINITY_DN3031_c2_g1_i3:47-1369(-)